MEIRVQKMSYCYKLRPVLVVNHIQSAFNIWIFETEV